VVFDWAEAADDGADHTTVGFDPPCIPAGTASWVTICHLTGTETHDLTSFKVEGTFDRRTICFQRTAIVDPGSPEGSSPLPADKTETKRFDGTFTDRNTMELSVTSSEEPCPNPIQIPVPSLVLTRNAITGMVLDNGKKPVSGANVHGADASNSGSNADGNTEQGGNFILQSSFLAGSRQQNAAAPYDLTVEVSDKLTVVYKGLTHGDSTLIFDTAPEAAANNDILNDPEIDKDPVSGADTVTLSWTATPDRVYVLDIKPVAPSTAPELRFVTTDAEVRGVPVASPPVPGEAPVAGGVTLLSDTKYECFVDAYGPFKSLDDATVYASDGSSPLAGLPLTRSDPRPFPPPSSP
jgi:hypothetical protein